MNKLVNSLACAVMLSVLTTAVATAADKATTTTTINVKGMHCSACAKKLTDQMKSVKGVAQTVADAEKGIAFIIPHKGNKLPSPRAQWEAVEKVGFKPIRLAGPFGVFTSKPKF